MWLEKEIGMRVARVMVVMAAGALLGGGLLAGPAVAGPAGPEPWETWEQPEFTVPAGRYCDFPMRLEVISQDIERRTISRYRDGTIHWEQYRGPLVNYWINEDTGEQTIHDAGGELWAEYYPDGAFKKFVIVGPVGVGFPADAEYPRGYYILDGFHIVSFDRDGVRRMQVDHGEEEDVCAGLS
jgi:hypothetical protein